MGFGIGSIFGGGSGGGLGGIFGGGSGVTDVLDIFDKSPILGPLDLGGTAASEAAEEAADSQEAQFLRAIAELRRQFNVGQENIAPYLAAGQTGLPVMEQMSTLGGYDSLLNEIMGTDTFQGLRDERMRDVSGMLAAGRLSRSGAAMEEAAKISPTLATQIAGILGGNAGNLANIGQSSAVGSANLSQNLGTSLAGQYGNIGAAQASGILGSQQGQAQGVNRLLDIGSILAGFSDPALKTNVREIGEVGPLTLYQWDWKPEFKDTIVSKGMTMGFMADEVREKYPEYVGEFGGFDVIDYPGLIEALENGGTSHG